MKINLILSLLFLQLIISCQDAAHPIPRRVTSYELPFRLTDQRLKPLRQLTDGDMQLALYNRVSKSSLWTKLINEKKLAIGVVDIHDPYNIRYAAINGDDMMYAASLPKISILLAAMDAFEKNELQPTPKIMNDLNAMIRVSDNEASTRMIDLLGYQKIEEVMTDPRYKLYDEDLGGGLWVGKRYAPEGARHPEPLKGISHAATVFQVCRFYYLLAFGKLVSFERSKEMLKILSKPGIHHKFVKVLEKIAPNARLFRKSGSWKIWHSDSVIVWGNGWRKYILVALVEDSSGNQILETIVPAVEQVLQSFNK